MEAVLTDILVSDERYLTTGFTISCLNSPTISVFTHSRSSHRSLEGLWFRLFLCFCHVINRYLKGICKLYQIQIQIFYCFNLHYLQKLLSLLFVTSIFETFNANFNSCCNYDTVYMQLLPLWYYTRQIKWKKCSCSFSVWKVSANEGFHWYKNTKCDICFAKYKVKRRIE